MRTIVDAITAQDGGTGILSILDGDGAVAATLPWSAVHDRARRMATCLAGAGVGPGERVGVLADTGLDLVCAVQAGWLAGAAVTVLPPPTRRADSLAAIIADARPRLLLADPAAVPVLPRGPGGPDLVTLPDLAAAARFVPPATVRAPDPAALAVLQYTSGSTRTPRGVPVTHAHLAANIDAIRAATGHEAQHPTRMLSWLPLYHDLGLIGFLALPMACGTCSLLLQSPAAFLRRPAGWLAAMSRHRATTSGAPNFAYELMTGALTAGLDVDLSPVRFLLTGGEPVDAAMMARFVAAAGARGLDPAAVVPAYGLAESTLGVTFSPPRQGLRADAVRARVLEQTGVAAPDPDGRRLVLLGRPVPGTTLHIADRRTGAPLGERQVGRVEIRGPSVVGHYWGEPVPAPGTWLRTGDLGYLAGGELVVCGREKDVLFAAGRNIFPQDVEAAAADVPGVRRGAVAAFGLPGERGDRLVVAVESRGADAAALRREVTAAVRAEVGLTPYAVLALPAGRLPKTSSGKLRRAETRRRYQAGELTV
jgi:fatty-acyl-CoA synthase